MAASFGGYGTRPAGLSEGEAAEGLVPTKLNLSSYLYTLAFGASTLDSVLAAFSPLRRRDCVLGYPTSCSSLGAILASLRAREEGPEKVRRGLHD